MRKWIVLLLVLIVLCFGAIYLLIPNSVVIKERTGFVVNAKAFTRSFFDETTWPSWWPGTKHGGSFAYNGNEYRLLEKRISSLVLSVSHGQDSLLTELVVIPIGSDSIELNWLGTANANTNPVARLQAYGRTKSTTADLQSLFEKIKAYYANPEHLYPISIKEEKVVDSTLIFTSMTLKNYPATEDVYSLIDKLKAFATKNDAKQTGLPMLNITGNNDSGYLTRVALPVDKKLKDEGDIHYKWMLGGGNILVGEVKGGPLQIEHAFAAMEAYVEDHHRIAPAIPFQSLVTDRRAEPDTAKWVTRIYWPVM